MESRHDHHIAVATRSVAAGFLVGVMLIVGVVAGPAVARPADDQTAPVGVSATYGRFAQSGWWDQRRRYADGADRWVHEDYPTECFQNDQRAGGVAASAWQVLWAYPASHASQAAQKLGTTRAALAQASSIFAASAERTITNRREFYRRSLSPRWVTALGCEIAVQPIRVPDTIYHLGPHPFTGGGMRDWLFERGFTAANRKYLVLLQDYPDYTETGYGMWSMFRPVAENWAATTGDRRVGLDNVGNYNAFAFVHAWWPRTGAVRATVRAAEVGQTIAHEMVHAMGAVPRVNHNEENPGHPSECNDVLCYNSGHVGERYVCGRKWSWLPKDEFRLDCGRNDYYTVAGDGGRVRQAWANWWPNLADSPFLYGNPQPSRAQLVAGRAAIPSVHDS